MQKLFIAFTTSALVLGSGIGAVRSTPLTDAAGMSSQHYSAMQKIGCTRAGDNCPYGYRIERHGGKGWSCEPCWEQKHGSRYRDWNDRYYEPRQYRDYGEEGYDPRRYRYYGDQGYDPRWYRNY
jgi:hypothetical protein